MATERIQHQPWWKRWWEWWFGERTTNRWVAIFTGVLAVASIYQYSMTRGQLEVMRGQLDAMNKQLSEMQKGQKSSLYVTKTSLDDTKVSELQSMRFGLQIVNAGKVAAKEISIHSVADIVRSDREPTFNQPIIARRTRQGLVFPGETMHGEAAMVGQDEKIVVLSSAQKEELTSGRAYIAIYGQISYIDDYGPHWATFCHWRSFAEPGRFRAMACVAYNRTGDGKQP